MSKIKHSALWALTGVVLGLVAFLYNYTMVPLSLPGYDIIVQPGMLALSLFSEETAFWPKLLILLSGQYLGYFIFIHLTKILFFSLIQPLIKNR